MSRRRHTPEQVVRKLREADRLLGEGMELPEVFKQLEVSEQTYCRWPNRSSGINAEDVKRLTESRRRGGALSQQLWLGYVRGPEGIIVELAEEIG